MMSTSHSSIRCAPTPFTGHTPRRARRLLLTVFALLAAVAVIAVAGCGRDDTPAAPSSGDIDEHYQHTPGPADAAEPSGVLREVLGVIFSWEPVTDSSPTDALRRAAPQLSGDALRSATAPPATGVRQSPEWGAWRSASDLIVARVDNARATLITADRALGQATITQTVLGVNGSSTLYQRLSATTQLTRVRGQWTVSTYPQTTEIG